MKSLLLLLLLGIALPIQSATPPVTYLHYTDGTISCKMGSLAYHVGQNGVYRADIQCNGKITIFINGFEK